MVNLLNFTNYNMNHLTYVENKEMPHYRSIQNTWIIKILFEKFFVS